jgi:hypothetical protein
MCCWAGLTPDAKASQSGNDAKASQSGNDAKVWW